MLSISNTFVAHQDALAEDVNQNFSDIQTWANNLVSWKSWTPTYGGSTDYGTGTYSVQKGRYCQIEKIVHFTAYVITTNHNGTGNLRSNLPVAVSTNLVETPISIYISQLNLSGANQVVASIHPSLNLVVWAEVIDNSSSIAIGVDTVATLRWSGSYEVD